ncbi:nitroreductase/quinone reductase family protein [Quadrisphaera granulorum]|uniref:nitroreductase/quinone reductase family protein n=1 Tax=Quadrisphaera granulorum TaxID=317664 RepID=UPI000D6C8964|nr:nitroreductase/quinone reductase family protein [Quadrisphaera granulorum]
MTEDFNTRVIREFRENDGRVGPPFEGAPMILVHHRGRRSGTEHVAPLVFQQVDAAFAVFASKGGAPVHPQWYANLLANPDTTAEVGAEHGGREVPVRARELHGEERAGVWEEQKRRMPGFADYEVKAAPRVIPVVLLEPR